MPKLFDLLPYKQDYLNKVDGFIAGIECEIESVDGLEHEIDEFRAEADGSLRNHGVEYISIPLKKDDLLASFRKLHANITYYDKAEAFSPRTSTHVHINVRTLEPTQLKQLLLFYALYEEFFFSMVDPLRRENIHCVALTETAYPARYKQDVIQLAKNWHKYSAFNLLPVFSQGTVEFRHLQGTDDAALLDRWLSTLNNLWTIAQTDKIDKTTITNNAYHARWFQSIFKDAPEILALEPAMPNKIQNSLIDVKMALI